MPRSCRLWAFNPKLMKRMSTFTNRFIVIPGGFSLIFLFSCLQEPTQLRYLGTIYTYWISLDGSIKSDGFNRQLHSSYQLAIPLLAYNRFSFRLYEPANQYFFDHTKYNQVRRVRGEDLTLVSVVVGPRFYSTFQLRFMLLPGWILASLAQRPTKMPTYIVLSSS